MCYNAVDRHVLNGDGENVAFIYDSAYLNIQEKFTYNEVLNRVGRIASVLKKKFGVVKGDRVLLYMPMIPVSAFFMLACARIGAIHSVVFGGFAAKELSNRIDDCKPKVIITASCGLEPGKVIHYRPIVDEALKLCQTIENAQKVVRKIIVQRRDQYLEKDLDKETYFDYDELIDDEEEVAECTFVESTHELYILCIIYIYFINNHRYVWYHRCAKRNCQRYWRNSCCT